MCLTRTEKRNEKWTLKDTARTLNLSIGYICEELRLADDCNEILSKLNRKLALKILRNNG